MLNSDRYPLVDYDLDFPNNKISRVFDEAARFSTKYFEMDELVTNSNINPADYKTLFPLFVFDVSKQSERLKASVIDIQVKALFAAASANTEAFALVISDKLVTFQSNGQKMSVLY